MKKIVALIIIVISTHCIQAEPSLPLLFKIKGTTDYVRSGQNVELEVIPFDFYSMKEIESGVILKMALVDSESNVLVESVNYISKNQNRVLIKVPADLMSGGYLLALYPADDEENKLGYSVFPINIINLADYDPVYVGDFPSYSPDLSILSKDSIEEFSFENTNSLLKLNFHQDISGAQYKIMLGDSIIKQDDIYSSMVSVPLNALPNRLLEIRYTGSNDAVLYFNNGIDNYSDALGFRQKSANLLPFYRKPKKGKPSGNLFFKGKSSNEGAYQVVTLSARGETSAFQSAFTDVNGNFKFDNLDQLLGINEVQVKLNSDNATVAELNTNFATLQSESNPVPYRFHEKPEGDILREMLINKFYNSKPEEDSIHYFVPSSYEKEIVLKNYESLTSVEEMINELLPLSRFNERKGAKRLRLLNPLNNSFYSENPLILVDGFVISSIDELLLIPAENMERFIVSYAGYKLQALGPLGRYGAVSFFTKKGNYVPKDGEVIKIKGPRY